MKWVYKIASPLLFICMVVLAVLTIIYFGRVNKVYEDNTIDFFGENPKYHFSLILNSEDDKYWQDFKEGIIEAGKAYNAAIEFNAVDELESNIKTAEYINIANKSKVDGIIVNGKNSPEYSEAINNAPQSGINIVVGVVESVDSDRLSYVGTNFYDYGILAAKLIVQAGGGKPSINLAVILSDVKNGDSDRATTSQSDVMISGLKSAIEGGQRIELLSTLYRNNDLLGAEDLTRDILTQHPDVDVIFCTNAKDTVAAARVIVERNLVGKVAIVGTDITEDVKYYINKGIVFGVLDRNGRLAGYKSVEILCNSAGNLFQSNYINIDTEMYTSININQADK